MDTDLDFKKVDLYELFDVLPEATESQIKKAYRKKALVYHPDKNPGNPKANEIFQKLSKALEVLTDKEARSSYDKILKARKDREVKNRQLDAKRRKLRDELDAREKVAQEESILNEEEKLRRDIERIRKEGSRQLEEENFMLKMKLEEQRKNAAAEAAASIAAESNRVKIRRKTKVELTEALIRQQFGRFGSILFVIVSKNGKSAVVEFESAQSLRALQAGCPSNFEAEILSISEASKAEPQSSSTTGQSSGAEAPVAATPQPNNHEDYESFVFAQMLQAAGGSKRKAQE